MSRVYVGMSGGVDSSVTAALLQAEGHQVTGVYMKNWTEDLPGMRCPWADDLADAKRVAVQLNIPFTVFDFQREYKQRVVDYMVAEYKAGRTPNPDIMCNQEIKFQLFLQTSLAEGAEAVATGHYACTHDGRLFTAMDSNKDQTYFLYRVTEEALRHTMLPIGHFTKPEVRRKAAELGLATATKKDSQGICFIGSVGIKDFLMQYVQSEPGDIIDRRRNLVVGRHDGAIYYTIGQRHGLNVGGGLPYYVAGKDMERNIVYVTTDLNDPALWHDTIGLNQVHWINQPPNPQKTYMARCRYRAPLLACRVQLMDELRAWVRLSQPERAITPGQSVVFYDDNRVVGGGIVVEGGFD